MTDYGFSCISGLFSILSMATGSIDVAGTMFAMAILFALFVKGMSWAKSLEK